jgi:hypothetical protein
MIPQLFIKMDGGVVGKQVHMLAGELLEYGFHHFAGDAEMVVRAVGPHIHDLGIADAVGECSDLSNDLIAVIGDTACEAVFKAGSELFGRAAVVEVILVDFGFDLVPVDAS